MELRARIPAGPLAEKWDRHRFEMKLVNPANNGACVAACTNASASLFVAAKIAHLGLLPQGQPERSKRVLKMVSQMDIEAFGNCTNIGECQDACPKLISIDVIARMNRDFLRASLIGDEESAESVGAI